ncbi:MAG TPA: hypothetical protein VKV39_04205 [Candidatus Sulfotelmatobacter sp.]|nr:hypothetical protein [Candidatus Sulfotelmatobacter sp.]
MRSFFLYALVLLTSLCGFAQQASENSNVVPALVNFTGVLHNDHGRPITELTGITFALYKDSEGGAPMWLETQNVQPDKTGHYSVMLGSTTSQGLTTDLFAAGEARWLGVQVQGQAEQPRVLLLSVPYAMKAADAQTLGGLPPSAFLLAPKSGAAAVSTPPASAGVAVPKAPSLPAAVSTNAATNVTTSGGTSHQLAMFTSANNIQNSIISQIGSTFIDVTGRLGINTKTPTQNLDVNSGNAIVRGLGNFRAKGDTATLYVGDISHPIQATYATGLAIGANKAPTAIFIADFTGNVGVGTTTPTDAILNSVSNSASVAGLSAVGFNAPQNSFTNGTDGLHVSGGAGDPYGFNTGGAGAIINGGAGSTNGGTGASINGGPGTNAGNGGIGLSVSGGTDYDDFAGGDAIVASGGNFGGVGLIASGAGGASYDPGVPGIITTGGQDGGGATGGPGIVANGAAAAPGSNGGNGISAIGGPSDPSCPTCVNGLAGSFTGDVSISGNLMVAGTKSFRIDHPLDPANKYLYHAALESSEALDLYSGNAVLDENGEATVHLPGWFEALNRDFRYQLTAIGAAAPSLHIAQEIENHTFRVAGGTAGLKVSWQVTGIRQDAWEKAHPMPVEVAKSPRDRGYYINPELYGAPHERNMDYAHMPQVMKRLRVMQQKQAQRQALARQANAAKPARPH